MNKLSVIRILVEYQDSCLTTFVIFWYSLTIYLIPIYFILFRLALTAMNKFEEAVTSYQKALDLDPENDSYKSNLKIAEQKLREVSSPVSY